MFENDVEKTARSGGRWPGPRRTPSGVDRVLDALDARRLALFADGMVMGARILLRAIRAEALRLMLGARRGGLGVPFAGFERFAQSRELLPDLLGHRFPITRALGDSGGALKGGGIYNAGSGTLTLQRSHIGEVAIDAEFLAPLRHNPVSAALARVVCALLS